MGNGPIEGGSRGDRAGAIDLDCKRPNLRCSGSRFAWVSPHLAASSDHDGPGVAKDSSRRGLAVETLSMSSTRHGRRAFRPALDFLEQRELLTTLPSGFAEINVASGLIAPTTFEFAPDGRIFIA